MLYLKNLYYQQFFSKHWKICLEIFGFSKFSEIALIHCKYDTSISFDITCSKMRELEMFLCFQIIPNTGIYFIDEGGHVIITNYENVIILHFLHNIKFIG